jgi:aryl sulfotransferase
MLARVPETPVRYRSNDEDSARWVGFPLRQGDIVISTRSKSGTTWMQMVAALLVFQTPDLPRPLAELSPWLDWLVAPRDEVYARLAAQQHRRFLKTHTPLDGIVLDARATYIVVARHPLDAAVSLYHQGNNLDRGRMRELLGTPAPAGPAPPRPTVHEWLTAWIESAARPEDDLDSLPGVLWHLSDAWARRGEPNVVLVHYDDLVADLEGEMRRLAALLGITVADGIWPDLVAAATFESMRAGAQRAAPNAFSVLKDGAAFFRRGTSGAGLEELTGDEIGRYRQRAAALAPPDLLAWLHREEVYPRQT